MVNPATQTAYGPIMAVAAEQSFPESQRLIRDELAIQFLPSGWRHLAKISQWPPARNLLFSIMEKRWSGVWGIVLCRKRYITDKLTEALKSGIGAVVILGAGMDTLAYRVPALAELQVYEVDLPENIAIKRELLERMYGKTPAHVTLVAVDLEQEDLGNALAPHGFPLTGYTQAQKSFVVWEAVTQYLTDEGVRNTLSSLGKMKRGSQLVFTYICKDFYGETTCDGLGALYRDFRAKQPLWKFGIDPGEVGALLQDYGWKVLEQVGSQEFIERYVKPSGRILPVMEVERVVYAEK